MKKTLFFVKAAFLLLSSTMFMTGCVEEKGVEERYLSLVSPETESVSVSGAGEELDISVHSNLQWTIKAEAEGTIAKWISFSQTSGSGDETVTATILKGTYEARTASIIVTSKDEQHSCQFNIVQESTGEAPEAEGYNLPAYSIFQNVSDNDVSLGIANATVDGAVCKFDNGASITMSGKASQVVFSAGNYYQLNAKFTGWGAEDAKDLIMRIPVREEISGDMRMFWGWTSDVASEWDTFVSADGEKWTETGKTISIASGSRFNRDLFFSVPGTVPAGGALYLKLVPKTKLGADNNVQFCTGFFLTKSKPDGGQEPSGEKVLYSCNFNNVTDGCPYDLPLGYLRSASVAFDPSAFGYDGIGKGGTVASEWGSVRIGSGSGAASLTFPPLSSAKLGNGVADVKVSFKAVLYQSADYLKAGEGKASCNIEVSVAEGEGNVENGAITDLQNWSTFESRSVVIKGVNKDTRIKIGIAGGSGDRRFYLDDVVVEAISDIVVPSITTKTLTEVLGMENGTISESIKTSVTIISDSEGGNLPKNTAVVTDGTSYAALSLDNVAKLTAGKRITLALKGASLDKSASVITAKTEMITEEEDGSAPAPEAISISQLASMEYHFVEVKSIQATDAFVGKKFEGEVTMENADKETLTLNIYSTATFAGGSIPESSGSVKGIVLGGKLCPRTGADINLVLDRIGEAGVKLFSPVFCTYEFTLGSKTPEIKNAAIDGNKVAFTNGGSIEKVGGTGGEFAFEQGKASTPHNVYVYSTGWNSENTYYLLKCKAVDEISGKVAVTFSLNSAAKEVQQVWNIFWSNNGTDWTPTEYTWNNVNNTDDLATKAKNTFTAQNTTSKGITRTEFVVPAGKKIGKGESLYVKIVPSATLKAAETKVQLGFGFYVTPGDIINTKKPSDAIVFNNFAECTAGTDYMLGSDIRYFGNVVTPAYEKDGWVVSKGYSRIGYTMYGAASSGDHGITTPALTGISGTGEVTLTFKCCLYMPSTWVGAKDDIVVKVAEGEGTVGEITWDSEPETDYFHWHTATVKITGATAGTKLFIGAGAGKVTTGDRRFFLDDIIVK